MQLLNCIHCNCYFQDIILPSGLSYTFISCTHTRFIGSFATGQPSSTLFHLPPPPPGQLKSANTSPTHWAGAGFGCWIWIWPLQASGTACTSLAASQIGTHVLYGMYAAFLGWHQGHELACQLGLHPKIMYLLRILCIFVVGVNWIKQGNNTISSIVILPFIQGDQIKIPIWPVVRKSYSSNSGKNAFLLMYCDRNVVETVAFLAANYSVCFELSVVLWAIPFCFEFLAGLLSHFVTATAWTNKTTTLLLLHLRKPNTICINHINIHLLSPSPHVL